MVAESLIADVLEANRALQTHGLAPLTWGNASGIDRDEGLMVIKPSGVAYEQLTEGDMVVVDLDGNVITGPHPPRRPSTDTPTHLVLYRAFEEIGGIVHTHSTWGVAWAQAQREIPLLGTTHADLCACPIPVTRALTDEEIADKVRTLAVAVPACDADQLIDAVWDLDSAPDLWRLMAASSSIRGGVC